MSDAAPYQFAPAPAPVSGDDCGAGLTDQDAVLGLRVAALFAILGTSAIGGFLPLVLKARNLTASFFLGTCFAAGVVVATGFAHVLPDAVEAFTDPCLGFSGEYPWAEVFAGGAALVTFGLETLLRSWIARRMGATAAVASHSSHSSTQDLASTAPAAGVPKEGDAELATTDDEKRQAQHRREMDVIAIMLEAGFVFHSIFIGLDIGITRDANVARTLMIALMFHQGFEGIALGSQFMKAQYSVAKYIVLMLIFVLITPIGIAIGIGVGNSYQASSHTALGFEGAFNAVSAGILIYNGLVDLILPALEASPHVLPRGIFQAIPWLFLFAGYSCMSLLAKWA